MDTLNVWDEKLPEFDQEAIGAKYKGINKEPMDEAEQKVWDRIQELVARFKRADRLVIGVPMWNFAYPYKLKQLIDPPDPALLMPATAADGQNRRQVTGLMKVSAVIARPKSSVLDNASPLLESGRRPDDGPAMRKCADGARTWARTVSAQRFQARPRGC